MVCRNGLDDHRGDSRAFAAEEIVQRLVIVERQHASAFDEGRRHARRRRLAERGEARTRRNQKMVGVAVIAAGVFHDEIAPGERAGHADRAHHRLGARRHEAHLLERGIGGGHALGKLDFPRARRAEGGAVFGGIDDRRDHFRMCMAENERAPRGHEVEETPAIDILYVRTLAARDEQRRAADRTKRAHG